MRSGDILIVDFGIPTGSTPAKLRPAIVVTADPILANFRKTLHVVPVTTNVGRAWISDVYLDTVGLAADSVAQCHLCTVIDSSQIVDETIGNVGAVLLAQIRSVIGDLLDIG